MRVNIVVVGNGMAGSRLVSEVRARDRAIGLTVFGAEPWQPYNRILLSSVLSGAADPDTIRLVDPVWYDDHDVDARLGTEVTRIDTGRKVVLATDGTHTRYDALVLATGSAPVIPPLPGLDDPLPEGVVAFRTVDDCRDIITRAASARTAVVVGGGLLGLEAARGLAGRGIDVTVIHLAGHLMERQLDAEAGRVLKRTLAGLGITIRVATRLDGLTIDHDRRVRGVELAADPDPDLALAPGPGPGISPSGSGSGSGSARVCPTRPRHGTRLDADLVVLACGIRPEVSLARAAGLAVERGVVVDDRLRSVTDPAVYAIGECAQHDGTVYGLVAPAWEQAACVADLLTGGESRYTGSRQVTRLKAASVELAAMGETHLDDDEATAVEVVRFSDPARGAYRKIVIRDDRLVGAILLGETSAVGTLTQFYDRGAPLPADRIGVLFPGLAGGYKGTAETPLRMPNAARVCECNNVTKGKIRACWEAGARTVEDVAAKTHATTGCGGCRTTVEGIVAWLSDQEPAPAP